MHYKAIFSALLLLALLNGGCTATYIPISWGMGEKVKHLSSTDPALSILYNRFDPKRETLRVSGSSFNQVMMPSEVKHHLGAYRNDTKLIYRNLYQEYTDQELRNLMLHELAHHIWYSYMTRDQRFEWGQHLEDNPTPLRDIVRRIYKRPQDHPAEDFAFTVEFAREEDLEELARMKLITEQEKDQLIKALLDTEQPDIAGGDKLSAVASEAPRAQP